MQVTGFFFCRGTLCASDKLVPVRCLPFHLTNTSRKSPITLHAATWLGNYVPLSRRVVCYYHVACRHRLIHMILKSSCAGSISGYYLLRYSRKRLLVALVDTGSSSAYGGREFALLCISFRLRSPCRVSLLSMAPYTFMT